MQKFKIKPCISANGRRRWALVMIVRDMDIPQGDFASPAEARQAADHLQLPVEEFDVGADDVRG